MYDWGRKEFFKLDILKTQLKKIKTNNLTMLKFKLQFISSNIVDYGFRKTFPDTVVLKMLDKIIMTIEQENSLETEIRRKNKSISCIGAKGQYWRTVECIDRTTTPSLDPQSTSFSMWTRNQSTPCLTHYRSMPCPWHWMKWESSLWLSEHDPNSQRLGIQLPVWSRKKKANNLKEAPDEYTQKSGRGKLKFSLEEGIPISKKVRLYDM